MHGKTRKKDDNTDELIISDLGVNKESKSKRSRIFNPNTFNFNIKFFAIAVLLVIVIATAFFAIRFMSFNSMVMIWRTNLTKGSDNVNNKSVEYESFREGLVRISNDGVTYVDKNGNINWTISYNIKEPIYSSSGKYFSIADKNGNNFYIFGEKGVTGSNTTTNPIIKTSMSDEGVLYVMQSDDNNSFINVFRSNGDIIDLSIKTNLTEDGMPIDISTSKSGEELSVAYVCLDEDVIYTKATYYNFADAGKNAGAKRIVGEFTEEFNGKFIARVHHFNDKKSVIVYDGGMYYVLTDDPASPRIVNRIELKENISSISYNDRYFAMIYDDNKLSVYDDDGKELCDREIDFEYTNFYINDDYVIFLDERRVVICDSRGRIIFDKELSAYVEYVAKKKNLFFTELLVGLTDSIECVRFY